MEYNQNQIDFEEGNRFLIGALSLSILGADPNTPIVRAVNALIDSIGECYGPFVKELTDSDVAAKQNRLLLPKLSMGEFIELLLKPEEDPVKGVPVQTFNTAGKAYPMQLKRQPPNSLKLLSNWNTFVDENQLKKSPGVVDENQLEVVAIWAFRAVETRGLCFVISSI